MLRIGVIVNPIAGIGGPAAMKGSDGVDVQRAALARGATPRANERLRAAFAPLLSRSQEIALVAWGGAMGADALRATGFAVEVLGTPPENSSAADTRAAARAMVEHGIDLLVFAGGDGTARDLVDTIPAHLPVIGVPAGVKMHSGVFVVTPRDAADLIARLLDGGWVAADVAEVRDIDEAALREGRVATQFHGELSVLRVGGYLQHVKAGGREVEELVLAEIAEEIARRIAGRSATIVLGPGSTVAAVKKRLGIEPTLLGFDVVRDGRVVALDADAARLEELVDDQTVLIVSFTRGQGFLIGRGNQQLTPTILRRLARENIWIVGSRTKLLSLEGRPLLVDSGADDVDARLRGVVTIISGYEDALVYRVGR